MYIASAILWYPCMWYRQCVSNKRVPGCYTRYIRFWSEPSDCLLRIVSPVRHSRPKRVHTSMLVPKFGKHTLSRILDPKAPLSQTKSLILRSPPPRFFRYIKYLTKHPFCESLWKREYLIISNPRHFSMHIIILTMSNVGLWLIFIYPCICITILLTSWFSKITIYQKDYPARAHTCSENALKTRFQDVQNFNSEDVHKT